MSERAAWVYAFEGIGMGHFELFSMTEEEFCEKCQFLSDAGLAPDLPVPRPNLDPPFDPRAMREAPLPSRVTSDEIRRTQNEEFVIAESLAQKRIKDDQERKDEEQRVRVEQVRLEKENRANVRNVIRQRAAALPEESKDGILIAITLPSRGRIQRKFRSSEPAQDVFAFVADNEELFDENGDPLEFELSQGKGDLIRDKTLAEQGVTGRTLLRVVVIE
jgi:hypothetical protein